MNTYIIIDSSFDTLFHKCRFIIIEYSTYVNTRVFVNRHTYHIIFLNPYRWALTRWNMIAGDEIRQRG